VRVDRVGKALFVDQTGVEGGQRKRQKRKGKWVKGKNKIKIVEG